MKRNILNVAIASLLMVSRRAGDDQINLEISYDRIDQVPESFRSLYSEKEGKAVLSRVVGLKTQDDINRLQGALEKERNDHKTVRSTLSRLGDRDIDSILADLDSIPSLQAAAKGGENIDDRIQGRLQQETAPLLRKIEGFQTENETLRGQLSEFSARETRRTISDNVVKFATVSKALPEAIEDIAFMANSIFETNESGQVVAKNGVPGVTPGISPEVWLTELKRSKPFYWPQSRGAGAGAGDNGAGGSNPWHKDSWNMTLQGQILRQDRSKAEQLAAQAGTKIGASKPIK